MITFKKIVKGLENPKLTANYIFRNLKIRYQIPNLSHVILYINSICNAHCLMCDIGQNRGRGIQALAYGEKFMPIEILKKILNDPLVRKKRFTFNITMTEPLLTPSIGEYIKEIKKRGHEVNVTTNGYLLPEKAEELIESGLDSVQVSLDGPKKVNDWIRGKKGFFDRAIKGLKLLEGKMPLRVNYTVSNLNYRYLREFTDTINSKVKVGLLKFQFLDFISEEMARKQNKYPFKQGVSSVDELVNPEKVDINVLSKQIKEIKNKHYKNIEKVIFIPNISEKEDLKIYFSKEGKPVKNYSICRWPYSQVAIKTNGDVLFNMRCFNYMIGNINKQSLKEIFYGKRAIFFRKEFQKARLCFPTCTRCCGVMFE